MNVLQQLNLPDKTRLPRDSAARADADEHTPGQPGERRIGHVERWHAAEINLRRIDGLALHPLRNCFDRTAAQRETSP